eukprot:CAMPEP_0172504716 /NCGR_PEP_ID=MMETSP1066-20121228/180739_1 /TAXON_ID=671091 /ORGANISM="Coscinodiscus wailesii, Strain CCMP2513" /LENGTH=314 /DNA_ID=CAMNT_0013281009 /DNA_START=12 /DNA_END=953 /DNA_ORIENTATION=+
MKSSRHGRSVWRVPYLSTVALLLISSISLNDNSAIAFVDANVYTSLHSSSSLLRKKPSSLGTPQKRHQRQRRQHRNLKNEIPLLFRPFASRGGESSSAAATTTSLPSSNQNLNEPSPSPTAAHLDYGATPLPTLLTTLSTSTTTGLNTTTAQTLLTHTYGPNALTPPPSKTLLSLILDQFTDRLVQILLIVAALSAAFSYAERDPSDMTPLWRSFAEPAIILAILVLNAVVGVWQSRSAAGSLEALKKLQPRLASVLRDGVWVEEVDASCLVPGDVIGLRVGDKVPADARLVSLGSSSLSVDEGSLTGESGSVE